LVGAKEIFPMIDDDLREWTASGQPVTLRTEMFGGRPAWMIATEERPNRVLVKTMAKTPLMFKTVNQPFKRLLENKAVAIRYRQSEAAIAYFQAFRDMRAAIDDAVKRKNMKLRKLAQAHGFEYDKVYRVYKLNADYPDGRAAIVEFAGKSYEELWPKIADTISGGGKEPIFRQDL